MDNREFDSKMRAYELSNDEKLRPDMYVIVRIDGKTFSTLTRQVLKVKPFDPNLSVAMKEACRHTMEKLGWNCIYGYTQSDEISILLDKDTVHNMFGGKVRKLNSLFAAHVSVEFYKQLKFRFETLPRDLTPVFDCRTIQIPQLESVVDYFIWRRNDSETNCLNAWAYYYLTQWDGFSPREAQSILDGRWNDFKHDILFHHDHNYDNIEAWQKRGIGFIWRYSYREVINKKTGEKALTRDRKIEQNRDLPKEPNAYINYLRSVISTYNLEKGVKKNG